MPNVNDKLATIMQGIDNVSPESRAQFVSDALAAAGRAARPAGYNTRHHSRSKSVAPTTS